MLLPMKWAQLLFQILEVFHKVCYNIYSHIPSTGHKNGYKIYKSLETQIPEKPAWKIPQCLFSMKISLPCPREANVILGVEKGYGFELLSVRPSCKAVPNHECFHVLHWQIFLQRWHQCTTQKSVLSRLLSFLIQNFQPDMAESK